MTSPPDTTSATNSVAQPKTPPRRGGVLHLIFLALMAAGAWGLAWWCAGGDVAEFRQESALAREMELRELPVPGRGEIFWLRQSLRAQWGEDGARAPDLGQWTLARWARELPQLDREERLLTALAEAAPLDAGADAMPPMDLAAMLPEDDRKRLLEDHGLTQEALDTRWALLGRALAGLEIRARQKAATQEPTEAELQRFYEQNRVIFRVPETFLVRHIFVICPEGTPSPEWENQGDLAGAFADRARAGESMAELAGEFSEDEATKALEGLLPVFSPERMPADFLRIVRWSPVGRITGQHRLSMGYHTVRVEQRWPARPLDFTRARPLIQNALREAALEKARRDVLIEVRKGLPPGESTM